MAVEKTDYLQVFTFSLAEEDYALEVSNVQEVLEVQDITKVPRMPRYMLGVLNLRGNVVPVIDLKHRLGMGEVERTPDSCIVIVEITVREEKVKVGALVDSVREVTNIPNSQIEPPPRLGTRLDTEFIRGIGKKDDRFIIILDINKVLTSEQIAQVAGVTAAKEEVPAGTEAGAP